MNYIASKYILANNIYQPRKRYCLICDEFHHSNVIHEMIMIPFELLQLTLLDGIPIQTFQILPLSLS